MNDLLNLAMKAHGGPSRHLDHRWAGDMRVVIIGPAAFMGCKSSCRDEADGYQLGIPRSTANLKAPEIGNHRFTR
jgi:hypothetical protein